MKSQVHIVAFSLAALLAFSCAGAPPPTTEAPEPTPAPSPAKDTELDSQMAQAKEKQAYIQQHGLNTYAPESFAQGEEQFAAATSAYETDPAAAKEKIAEALRLYDITIRDGFAKKIGEKKRAADEARARADAAKAKVAAKEEYAAASDSYNAGKKANDDSRWPEAVEGYEKAASGFDDAAKLAADRRAEADAAMNKAAESIRSTEDRMNAIDEELKDQGEEEQQ